MEQILATLPVLHEYVKVEPHQLDKFRRVGHTLVRNVLTRNDVESYRIVGPKPGHQDQYYWPVDTHNTITMWMPLIDINEEMGMLTFASGSHKKECVFETEILDESNQAFNNYVAENNIPISRPIYMNAGDGSWHYEYTIHNAPCNSSSVVREVTTIIYVADGAKVTAPKNKWQVNDLVTWMQDLHVGSFVSSGLNPLVL